MNKIKTLAFALSTLILLQRLQGQQLSFPKTGYDLSCKFR